VHIYVQCTCTNVVHVGRYVRAHFCLDAGRHLELREIITFYANRGFATSRLCSVTRMVLVRIE
jgi:hypothetical protein